MKTNWSIKGLSYGGKLSTWDEKDDLQLVLAMLQVDAVELLSVTLENGYVHNFVTKQMEYVNRAPSFWSIVVTALRFTLVMKFAKVFDESFGVLRINKAFNVLGQSTMGT